ncbi:alcohol dehydrogenase [Clostridioides difficile]|nr:alcohol dehydrogenase [Clostridioides difficile]
MNFNYNLPVNILFGRGRINDVGKEVSKYGKKVLIVTGKNSTKKTGLLDKTIDLLKDSKIEYEVFDKVEQNPLITTIYSGVEIIKATGCDCVLGLGGGSIMDAAKSIAFSYKNPGDLNEYIFGIRQGEEALPIILVPTTSGTGSEGNCFAVLTNSETKDKKSIKKNSMYAKASIIDPELMVTMPKHIIASVGFDALAHNMEAYLSNGRNSLADIQAIYGIELISKNLVRVYNNVDDLEAWEKITLASTIGGMTIGTAGTALPHGMEHPVSGLRDVMHGKGLAALTPSIVESSWNSDIERFGNISRILGGTCAEDCSDAIRNFLKKIDLDIKLTDLGVEKSDIDWLTDNCMKISAANIKRHPKTFNKEQIKEIYYKSL